MKIEIAGPGCPRCLATEKAVIAACAELSLNAEVTHLYDIKEYARRGVRFTPAVIVDGKVVVSGRVPTVAELKALLAGAEQPQSPSGQPGT